MERAFHILERVLHIMERVFHILVGILCPIACLFVIACSVSLIFDHYIDGYVMSWAAQSSMIIIAVNLAGIILFLRIIRRIDRLSEKSLKTTELYKKAGELFDQATKLNERACDLFDTAEAFIAIGDTHMAGQYIDDGKILMERAEGLIKSATSIKGEARRAHKGGSDEN